MHWHAADKRWIMSNFAPHSRSTDNSSDIVLAGGMALQLLNHSEVVRSLFPLHCVLPSQRTNVLIPETRQWPLSITKQQGIYRPVVCFSRCKLTMRGKFCAVARKPLPMDLLQTVNVCAPFNGEIFKVRSPVCNFPDKWKISRFGIPRDTRGLAWMQCKNSERNQGSEQISKPFIRHNLWHTQYPIIK
jgi:hypothetical protein